MVPPVEVRVRCVAAVTSDAGAIVIDDLEGPRRTFEVDDLDVGVWWFGKTVPGRGCIFP